MLDFLFSESFLTSALQFSIPIAFAALGALISNRAGVANIGIEGAMSMAALAGALVSYYTQSFLLGLLAAVAAGVLMSLILAFSALTLQSDSVLSGIALNTLASGLSVYLLYILLGVKGDSSAAPSVMIPNVSVPLLNRIPVLGRALFSQNLLFTLLIASGVFTYLLLSRTRLGMHMTAVGANAQAAQSVGIRVRRTRFAALILSGVFAGLGGAFLSMAYLSYYSAGMVGGRGFIGIAAEAMGAGRPLATLLFSLLFGAVDYFAVGAQAVLGVPYELLNTLPYLMTVLAMTAYALIGRKRKERKLS